MSGSTPGQTQRPARVLIGWLSEAQAIYFLNEQRSNATATPAQRARIEGAHAAVLARAAGLDQSGVIQDVPPAISAYVGAFQKAPSTQTYWTEGWRVALADLRKVCALQPHIYADHADERTAAASADDLLSVAQLSLPMTPQGTVPAQYDPQRQAWMLSSPNPNLHITGNWGGQVQPGQMGYGFVVAVVPSFVQVARFRDRFVLRDGYHRALGLLQRGISIVPVLVREYGAGEDLGLGQGWLPQSVYLGERPAVLTDYADDTVSAEAHLPAFQRMIVVPALEMTRLG